MSEKSQIELSNDWGHYCRNNQQSQSSPASFSSSYSSSSMDSSMTDAPSYAPQSSSSSSSSGSDHSADGMARLLTILTLFVYRYPLSVLLGSGCGYLIRHSQLLPSDEDQKVWTFLISAILAFVLSRIEKRLRHLPAVCRCQFAVRTLAVLSMVGYCVFLYVASKQ